jgi:hypothetical protein
MTSVVVSLLRYFLWTLSITDVFKFKIPEHQQWTRRTQNQFVLLKFDDSVVVSLLRYFLWTLSITDVFKFKILEHQQWIISKENTLKI